MGDGKLSRIFFSLLFLYVEMPSYTIQDNRCFLENGSSSETFFVPEDLQVGELIGRVRVVGDPRPMVGTISLRLKETDSPVTIEPGSKNLTLRLPLDKEGVDGPSSVSIKLICDRLGTRDPGFVIPVNIRVTDANDNAPVFINAPYVLNISEVTIVGTRVLQGIQAVDYDQQGPFSSVRYSILPGPHSDFFDFENELDGTLILRRPLDYEKLKSFKVVIRAEDHGNPPKSADANLFVNVMDADDQNPRFLDDKYFSSVSESSLEGARLEIKPREIQAFDQDEGIDAPIRYSFNGNGTEYDLFQLNELSGEVDLRRKLDGNDLKSPVVLVVRASQLDNPDRYALATLTVSRHSSNSIRFVHDTFYFNVSTASAPGRLIGILYNNRPGQHLKYFVSHQSILKTFAINTLGEITLKEKIDQENKQKYLFKVFATDGKTNDSSEVVITVVDANKWEPRFRYSHYEFYTNNKEEHTFVGKIEVLDGDRNNRVSLSVGGTDASMFYISPNGELKLRNIKDYMKRSANLLVTATDKEDPSRKSSIPITVYFTSPDESISGKDPAKWEAYGGPILLTSLGTILFVLSFVVAPLAFYICKIKRISIERQQLESESKLQENEIQVRNPVFKGSASNANISSTEIKYRNPKIHPVTPSPAHVICPSTTARDKKLSWEGNKGASDSVENLTNLDSTSKVPEHNNLTVYF